MSAVRNPSNSTQPGFLPETSSPRSSRHLTDENSSLLHIDTAALPHTDRITLFNTTTTPMTSNMFIAFLEWIRERLPTVNNSAKVGLAVIGSLAGALYYNPARLCSLDPQCGEWMAKIVGQLAAMWILFLAGAIEFGAISAFLATNSIESYIDYEKRQATWVSRVGTTLLICTYSFSQTASTFLALKTTSSSLMLTIFALCGTFPASFFSGVKTVEAAPGVADAMFMTVRPAFNYFSDCLFTPSEETIMQRRRLDYYHKLQKQFINDADAHLRFSITHPKEVMSNMTDSTKDDLLSFLFQQQKSKNPDDWPRYLVYGAGGLAGGALGSLLSQPFLLNTFGLLRMLMPIEAAAPLALYLSYSFLFTNNRLLKDFMTGVIRVLDNIVTGRKIESLPLQLHPFLTTAVLGVIIAISALSYSLANMMSELVFSEDTIRNKGLRYSIDITMILFHTVGLFHFFELILSKIAPNKEEKLLYKMKTEAENTHNVRLKDFIKSVEVDNISNGRNTLFGLKPFDPLGTVDLEVAFSERTQASINVEKSGYSPI